MPLMLLLAAFLLVHGAIHLSYLSPRPPATASGPAWPFMLDRSWLLTPLGVRPGVARSVGLILVLITLASYTLAAAIVAGVIPGSLWPAAIVLGSVSSITLLALFFHPWLVVGVVIDLALIAVVLWAGWSPMASAS